MFKNKRFMDLIIYALFGTLKHSEPAYCLRSIELSPVWLKLFGTDIKNAAFWHRICNIMI